MSYEPEAVDRGGSDMDSRDHSLAWWALKVAMGAVLIALMAERFLLGALPAWPGPPTLVGQAFVALGSGLAIGHYLGLKRRHRNLSRPGALTTGFGLYRYLRHPMYLGDLFVFAGLALLASGPLAITCLFLGAYAVRRQAYVEDRYMAGRFGAAHARWCERTGLLLPRLWAGRAA